MLTVRTSENTVITSFRLISERQDFSSVRTGENTVRARARIQSLSELVERLSKAEKKSETLKKINEADLLTIDDFGLGTLTAQEQSLVYEIIKSRADNLSTIIVSQRPCADWYEWLGGKYIADGVADRIINFYYLIELKGESRRALARKQAKEAAEL